MKTATLIAFLTLIPFFALSTERKKREYNPIAPIAGNAKAKDSAQKMLGELELPKHDPKRVYSGPESSLFPKLDLSSFKQGSD